MRGYNFRIFIFCAAIFVVSTQIVDRVRQQPWPVTISEVGRCCQHTTLPSKLIECLNSTKISKSSSNIAIVTYAAPGEGKFAIPDIQKFFAYQLGTVAAYAELRGYSYRLLGPETGSNFEPQDPRWNKVQIISKAISRYGWAYRAKFIVWVDADAIVLDFGLKIEEVGKQFPNADIIASSDIRMGYLNSGFVIFRNTPWVRTFLEDWWSVADRKILCDQDAFDLIYAKYLQQEKTDGVAPRDSISMKVKILHMDALNTHPPAMKYQQSHNQILHMMGEITPMRAAVFRTAFENICSARSGGKLQIQLGVDRKTILSVAQTVYSSETSALLAAAEHPDADYELFDSLSKSAHHLCDIYNTVGSEQSRVDTYELRKRLFYLVRNRVSAEVMKMSAIQALTSGATNEEDLKKAEMEAHQYYTNLLMLMKRAAEAGNDYYGASGDPAEKRDIAAVVFDILKDLHQRVAPDSKSIPLHMTALMHQNLGLLDYNLALDIAVPDQPLPVKRDAGGAAALSTSSKAAVVKSTGTRTGLDQRLQHLKSAQKSLTQSVKIFDSIFSSKTDSSTNREHVLSMQSLAAVLCLEGVQRQQQREFREAEKAFRSGLRIWKRTVDKANANLRGVQMGVAFESLAGVLHNAAVCNFQAGQLPAAIALSDQAIAVRTKLAASLSGGISRNGNDNDDDDDDDANNKGDSSTGKTQKTVESSEVSSNKAYLEMTRSLRRSVVEAQQRAGPRAASFVSDLFDDDDEDNDDDDDDDDDDGNIADVFSVSKVSSRDSGASSSSLNDNNKKTTKTGEKPVLKGVPAGLDGTKDAAAAMVELDDDEWEECEESDEDCQAFYVYDDDEEEDEQRLQAGEEGKKKDATSSSIKSSAAVSSASTASATAAAAAAAAAASVSSPQHGSSSVSERRDTKRTTESRIVEDSDDDEDGEEEEDSVEAEELAAIRAQYAKQTARAAVDARSKREAEPTLPPSTAEHGAKQTDKQHRHQERKRTEQQKQQHVKDANKSSAGKKTLKPPASSASGSFAEKGAEYYEEGELAAIQAQYARTSSRFTLGLSIAQSADDRSSDSLEEARSFTGSRETEPESAHSSSTPGAAAGAAAPRGAAAAARGAGGQGPVQVDSPFTQEMEMDAAADSVGRISVDAVEYHRLKQRLSALEDTVQSLVSRLGQLEKEVKSTSGTKS